MGLGTYSVRGVVYLFAGMTTAKMFGVAAQVVLAYLVSEKDVGVVGLAYTITTFIQVIEQAGVGDVLVQRKNFKFWVIPAFWLATCLGLLSSLLTVASAPIASAFYGNNELFWVLLGPGAVVDSERVHGDSAGEDVARAAVPRWRW